MAATKSGTKNNAARNLKCQTRILALLKWQVRFNFEQIMKRFPAFAHDQVMMTKTGANVRVRAINMSRLSTVHPLPKTLHYNFTLSQMAALS